jgi:polyisoprenoid-binding protein YceI
MRNWHIKSKRYLSVKKFPRICFESKQVISADEGYVATGDLTILEVTKQVSIPFSYRDGILEGTLKFDRHDFGVGDDNEKRVAPELDVRIKCILND